MLRSIGDASQLGVAADKALIKPGMMGTTEYAWRMPAEKNDLISGILQAVLRGRFSLDAGA